MCFHIIYWFFTDAISIFSEEDEAIKEKRYVRLAQTVPSKLAKLNEIIVKNNGHLAAGKVLFYCAIFVTSTTDHEAEKVGGLSGYHTQAETCNEHLFRHSLHLTDFVH